MAVIDMTIDVGIDAGEPVLIGESPYRLRYAANCRVTVGGGGPQAVAVVVDETRDATGRPVRTILFPPGVV